MPQAVGTRAIAAVRPASGEIGPRAGIAQRREQQVGLSEALGRLGWLAECAACNMTDRCSMLCACPATALCRESSAAVSRWAHAVRSSGGRRVADARVPLVSRGLDQRDGSA
jgi:hypothetical protein